MANCRKKLYSDFIRESYLLFDKNNLIEESFTTEINNLISVYVSLSYFGKNPLEFDVKTNTAKIYLNFQLAKVNGTNTTFIDKKIHRFSITKTGKKRKRKYMDPLETLIIRRIKSFAFHNQLNPIQVTINNSRL